MLKILKYLVLVSTISLGYTSDSINEVFHNQEQNIEKTKHFINKKRRQSEIKRKYYEDHKQTILKARAQYYADNKEEILKKLKDKYDNDSTFKQRLKDYQKTGKHKEYMKKYIRCYQQYQTEAINEYKKEHPEVKNIPIKKLLKDQNVKLYIKNYMKCKKESQNINNINNDQENTANNIQILTPLLDENNQNENNNINAENSNIDEDSIKSYNIYDDPFLELLFSQEHTSMSDMNLDPRCKQYNDEQSFYYGFI